MTKGYEDRSYERRQQYNKDGDTQAFLEAEEREASGAGFAYWSARAKALSALTRAELLTQLARQNEAATLLADLDGKVLDKDNRQRLEQVVERIQAQNTAVYDARDTQTAKEPANNP